MTTTPTTATDLRIPHTRWCPARSRRGHPERGFDKACLRCMAELRHGNGNHDATLDAYVCQPCELTVTLAANGLKHLWPMDEGIPKGFLR